MGFRSGILLRRLFVTESALNVWDRLLEGPRLLRYGYVAVMVALVVVGVLGAGWWLGLTSRWV